MLAPSFPSKTSLKGTTRVQSLSMLTPLHQAVSNWHPPFRFRTDLTGAGESGREYANGSIDTRTSRQRACVTAKAKWGL